MSSGRPPLSLDEPSGGGWSDPGAGDAAEAPAEAERYELGPMVGRGGMGVVRAARDTRLGRDVALKELAFERGEDRVARARLAREAAVTSRLDHPCIVPIYDVGTLPDGRPFYTMRLVRGRTLGEVAAATEGDARRSLVRHVLAAAEAVAVAHDAGLVHRDLKPANVLVGERGETQVVDWGLAAPTPAAAARWGDLALSAPRGRVGTERFMSPEQARGLPPDPRDDVYSLGATLREIVGDAAPAELAAVIARAAAPDAATRYADAGALADDLLRWFEGRRVAAYTYTPAELLRRVIGSYRLPLSVGAAGLVAFVLAVGVGWWQTSRSLDRALLAEAEASGRLADLQLRQAVTATEAGDRETAERLALDVLAVREDPLARGVFAAFGRAERPARGAEAAGPTCDWSAFSPGGGWILCGRGGTVTRWEGGREVWRAAVPSEGGAVRQGRALVWDPEGTTYALDPEDGAVLGRWARRNGDWTLVRAPRAIWADGAPLGSEMPASGCEARIEAAIAEGGRVAALCRDGTLVTGPDEGPMVRVPSEATGDHVATAMAFGAAGEVVVGTVRGRLLVLAPETGETRVSGDTRLGAVRAIVVAPDGRYAALDAAEGVGLARLDTGALVATVEAGRPRAVAFAEGALVLHEDGRVRTYHVPSGSPALYRARAGLSDVAVSPDGGRLAVAGGGGTALEIDLRDGGGRAHAFGTEVVKLAAWGSDGAVFSGMDGLLLAIFGPGGAVVPPDARPLRRAVVRPDGEIVGIDLEAGLYRWPRGAARAIREEARRQFVDLEIDGDHPVLLDRDGVVARLEGERLVPVATFPKARAAAARGERIVVATGDEVRVRDGDGERVLGVDGGLVVDVAIAPDGGRIAAGTLAGPILVWSADGRRLGTLPGHTERAAAVEFLPDGDLASASWDKTARIWDIGALDRPFEVLREEVRAAWGAD